jgi:hypothetical protein
MANLESKIAEAKGRSELAQVTEKRRCKLINRYLSEVTAVIVSSTQQLIIDLSEKELEQIIDQYGQVRLYYSKYNEDRPDRLPIADELGQTMTPQFIELMKWWIDDILKVYDNYKPLPEFIFTDYSIFGGRNGLSDNQRQQIQQQLQSALGCGKVTLSVGKTAGSPFIDLIFSLV